MSVNRIYSGAVGTCQTCNIPPRCAFDAEIVFSGKADTYRQDQYFFKQYDYLLEMKPQEAAEATLTLTARSKRCISKSPHCPTGNVFRTDGSLFGEFNPKKAFSGTLP